MKSLKLILAPLKAALLTVTDKVYHYEGLKEDDKYIVWAEDGDNSLNSDNIMTAQAIQGTIDYFTSEEYDENIDKIQTALNNARISFYLNSQLYDDETKKMQYQWVFEVT